jgi:transcription initiation factor IIE alpha subunit
MEVSDIQENYITGWIKIYRSIINKGWYLDSEFVHLWIHLIIEATHNDREYMWNGKIIKLKAGQFVTGRKKLSEKTGINESKIERILKLFESEQQIEQQKTASSRLISVSCYSKYQNGEQQIEQRMNNQRTTDEQLVNTKQEFKHLSIKEDTHTPFVIFWDLYNKKVGDRQKCEKKWKALKETERKAIIETLPNFKKQFSDKQFQPFPETYLNQKRWEDDIDTPTLTDRIKINKTFTPGEKDKLFG